MQNAHQRPDPLGPQPAGWHPLWVALIGVIASGVAYSFLAWTSEIAVSLFAANPAPRRATAIQFRIAPFVLIYWFLTFIVILPFVYNLRRQQGRRLAYLRALAFVLLPAALAFLLVWASAGDLEAPLVIVLPTLIATAIVGFLYCWLIDWKLIETQRRPEPD